MVQGTSILGKHKMTSLSIGEMPHCVPKSTPSALSLPLSQALSVLESVFESETDDPAQEQQELEVTFWAPGSGSDFLNTQCSTSASS